MNFRFRISMLFLLVLISPLIVSASYEISHSCETYCVKQRQASWNITISNDGSDTIEILKLSLVDFDTKEAIVETKKFVIPIW